MTAFRSISTSIYEKILIAVSTLIVMLPISPLNIVQPARDSGVFLYVAWRMLNGDVPYLDVWDHKPPMIFFFNALGLTLGGGSLWGVWLLEFILLFSASLIGFYLIKRFLGPLPAIFGLSLWLMSLVSIINKGNLATEYTLFFQFALLWTAVEAEEKGYFFWRGYIIGILAAIAFFTKQNMIAISLAILLYLIISRLWTRQYKTLLRALLVILLGGLTIIMLLLLYFVLNGAFQAFWDAAFSFNFVYIENTLIQRINGTLRGIRLLGKTGLTQFALLGWTAGLALFIYIKKRDQAYLAPLAIVLIALPLELILTGISGRGYKHYFMSLLPIFAIFSSLAFYFILSRIDAITGEKKAGYFFTIAAILMLLFVPFYDYYHLAKEYKNDSDAMIAERLREVTTEDDSILLWGNETAYNFTTQRVSPSRFNYQYPLYREGYTNQQLIEGFLSDIIENKPKLLIDTRNENTPIYQFPITSPQIEESIATLREHYQFREGLGEWTVYEYVENP